MYMYPESRVFMTRLFMFLRMGVTVGIVEGMDDEDWESGESFFRLFNDRQFRMLNGKVYCKGGSAMFPVPATDKDGWELEPVDKYFLEDMFRDGTIRNMYTVVHGHKVQLWTHDNGWNTSNKFLNAVALSKLFEPVDNTFKGVKSLTFVVVDSLREQIGASAMREYEYLMDCPTRRHLFKSDSWWVSL